MMDAILYAMLWLVGTVVTYSIATVALGVVAFGALTAGRSLWSAARGGRQFGHLNEA